MKPDRVNPAYVVIAAVSVIIVAVVVWLAVDHWGAGELPARGQTTVTTKAEATTSSTESQNVLLAREVATAWREAIQKLLPLLQGAPPVATIQKQVTDLKEQYVQKLVTLGHQIAALDASSQQEIYDRAMDTLSAQAGADWFTSYKQLYEPYASQLDQTSQDFAVLVSSFNTLTEYAFFAVLKDQDPTEATRLGIE